MIIARLKHLFTPDPARLSAHRLYVAVVNQARKPVFYRDWRIPDTLDGRFDAIVLHLFLAVSRLESDEAHADFIRALSEAFFADMDRSLREMGASDTGVGIRVKNMAQAFYGRLKAYGETIDNAAALGEALTRNVWREQPVDAQSIASLAAYMQRNHAALQAQPGEALMQGDITFSE